MRPVAVRRQSRRERTAYSSSGWAAASSLVLEVEVLEVEEEEVVEVVARRARFLVGAILRLPPSMTALRDIMVGGSGYTAMATLNRGPVPSAAGIGSNRSDIFRIFWLS